MPLETTKDQQTDLAEQERLDLAPETIEDDTPEKRGVLSAIPRKLRPWLLAGIAAVIAIGAWAIFAGGPKKTEMVTAPVTRGDIEQTVLATGVLEPSKLVSVGAQASGQVKKLYVELGDTVKAGDPIADIDSRTQTNTVANAQAGLSSANAQRAAASASLTQAQLNFERQERLFNEGAASKADYDSARAQLASAQASLTGANSQIKQSSLQLNTAETNLGYTKIVAPMDGVIVAVVTEEGQTVNANQSAPTIVMLAKPTSRRSTQARTSTSPPSATRPSATTPSCAPSPPRRPRSKARPRRPRPARPPARSTTTACSMWTTPTASFAPA